MIFKILSRKPAAADEVEATNRLSTKLGGLPLAVDIIAKQIRLSRRFRSVAEYLTTIFRTEPEIRPGAAEARTQKHLVSEKPGQSLANGL
jgi:hypothetical protein